MATEKRCKKHSRPGCTSYDCRPRPSSSSSSSADTIATDMLTNWTTMYASGVYDSGSSSCDTSSASYDSGSSSSC